MVSLGKIADVALVSKSTVSLALRNDPRLTHETRIHVKRVAKSLGYTKNKPLAASMRRMRVQKDTRSILEKLQAFTNERPNNPDACWEWQGSKLLSGYGRLRFGGRVISAHRASYEALVGPIPDGLLVLHKCDNPSCINPDHLFVGTHKDNTQDMISKGRKGTPVRRKPLSFYSEAYAKKLSRNDAEAIFASSDALHVIARRFGISQRMVRLIKSGKSWPHVRAANR